MHSLIDKMKIVTLAWLSSALLGGFLITFGIGINVSVVLSLIGFSSIYYFGMNRFDKPRKSVKPIILADQIDGSFARKSGKSDSYLSAVRSRAKAIKKARTFDLMFIFIAFFLILGGYHLSYLLEDYNSGFWSDWKDRSLWVTVASILTITFPAAIQSFVWRHYRLHWGAVFCVLCLILGMWINSYLNFWGWASPTPVNFSFPLNIVLAALILDFIFRISKSMTLTAVLGGVAWGLLFYPSNWHLIDPLHAPAEYNGFLFTLAELQDYQIVRTNTPEYVRMIEKGVLKPSDKDLDLVSALFSIFACILIYFIWHFFGRWFSETKLVESL